MYFSYSEEMVSFQVNEIIELVTSLFDGCAAISEYIRNLAEVMCLRARNNLYDYTCVKGQEIKEKGDIPNELHMLLSGIIDEMSFQYKE